MSDVNDQYPEWFILNDQNEQEGPMSELTVRQLFSMGRIGPNTLVWTQSLANWSTYESEFPSSVPPETVPRIAKTPVAEGMAEVAEAGIRWTTTSTGTDSPISTKNASSHTAATVPKVDGYFYRLFKGRFGLWKTFWLHLWLVSFLHTVVKFAVAGSATADRYSISSSPSHLRTLILVGAFFLWYESCATIGTWRAATEYRGYQLWSWLAKATCIPALLLISLQWLQLLLFILNYIIILIASVWK